MLAPGARCNVAMGTCITEMSAARDGRALAF